MLNSIYKFADITLRTDLRMIRRKTDSGEIDVRLSQAETLILAYFLTYPEQPCSKDLLLSVGWEGRPISQNSLPVAIGNLRRVLADANVNVEIQSIPRIGYVFSVNAKITKIDISSSETSSVSRNKMDANYESYESKNSREGNHRVCGDLISILHKGLYLWRKRALSFLVIFSFLAFFVSIIVLLQRWVFIDCVSNEGVNICSVSGTNNKAISDVPDTPRVRA
jgi:DNA-binding winged helix-turn-helix (wHTH) protein